MKKPVVAIVGRPNVGKSTFFNKVAGRRISIIKDEPGVTRDRIYADCVWLDNAFTLIDTGGIDLKNNSEVQKNIMLQSKIAIELADVILFFVDGKEGITSKDMEVADFLRKTKKPIILTVNKLDNNEVEKSYEFYELNLGHPFVISSEQSKGIGDLLDEVVKNFKEISKINEEDENKIKIAIVGKPNAGKSSLTNKLLGEERVVVSSEAGTTRDAIDTPFSYNGQDFILIDTAGIRRKRGIELDSVEQYSVIRSIEAIKRADFVILVIDSSEQLSEQDVRIAGLIHEEKKPSLIVMNKWDKISKDDKTMNEFLKKLETELSFMSYFETVFISCLTGQRVNTIMNKVCEIISRASFRISTSNLNEIIQDAVRMTQPPVHNGKKLKIYFATQTGTNPPVFTFKVNDSKFLHFSYQRYLENVIRKNINFQGIPIELKFKNKNEEETV